VRTILALGGGGFTSRHSDPALDELVLQLAASPVPRILFLPTASGDPQEQIARFHAAFGDRPCEPEVLSLFRLADVRRPLRDIVLSQDVIYVGGGSMRNLLAIWQVHGLDRLLRDAWERGVVLAGLSAGAMCWFQGGVTTSAGAPEPTPGLGFLPGSLSVHADEQPARRPVYLRAVADGTLAPGWLVDDGVGLLFRDMELERVVSARPNARAARVDLVEGATIVSAVEPDLIAPAPRGVPADVRELRAMRYGSPRD
jgi:peptidase E